MSDDGIDPLLYLTAAQVAELCREIDPLETVTGAFLAVRDGRAQVAPEAALRWTAPDGTAARSLVLPARYATAYGCKIINACIGNPARGLPRAHGLIMLFDQQTAAPVCVMEAGHISALRTAAVTVAALRAVRELAAVRRVAFLGCGRQARTHLELLATRSTPETVSAYDRHGGRSAEFAEQARKLLPQAAVTVADGPEEAVRDADFTVAATTTTTPYVAIDWVRPGAVFANVSLDDATEELLLGCDRLFVDDWALVSEDETRLLGRLAQAGRVTGPGDPPPPDGRAVDADLATLLGGTWPGPVTETDRVVINPFGMGVHDIALASQVYAAASAGGAGCLLPR